MEKLLPISDKDLTKSSVRQLRISMSNLLLVGCALAPFTMVYTILMTLIFDYAGSTYTHCQVMNILPSMSTVIRQQQPLWIFIIWAQLPARLLAAWLYWRYRRRGLPLRARILKYLSLLLLVYNSVSSISAVQYGHLSGTFHNATALSSWITGLGYIGLSHMSQKFGAYEPMGPHERLSNRIKRKMLFTNCTAMVVMWPFYVLHVNFCLTMAYSVFSFCEYILTLSIACHIWTSYLDFYDVYLCLNLHFGCFLADA
ncbi:post-GPI attachment to proteins factor 2 [Drosophila montana]|uniref:post-GPI attachment to proteins factor 2 n=1 Tax=Drosophila montana TaxID=40370 RepID=UPI00313C7EA0